MRFTKATNKPSRDLPGCDQYSFFHLSNRGIDNVDQVLLDISPILLLPFSVSEEIRYIPVEIDLHTCLGRALVYREVGIALGAKVQGTLWISIQIIWLKALLKATL